MSSHTEREAGLSGMPQPPGELAARTLAMPADTNPSGDMFGGWIMSLMDAAGAITATSRAGGRVVTAAEFTYVALDESGRPRQVDRSENSAAIADEVPQPADL